MQERNIVGIDIGGAHLKYADATRHAQSKCFALWKHKDGLKDQLVLDLETYFCSATELAVTMTGELADCFIDRSEGVDFIVDAVKDAAKERGIEQVAFYQVGGAFADADEAKRKTDSTAASNWHASAHWIAQNQAPFLSEPWEVAMVLDIGSTTTDIVPIDQMGVATKALTDFDRLAEGSLVYIGCSRTPLCAIVNEIVMGDQAVSVMNEVFATTDDVWILLGLCAPDENDCQSADGQPRTIAMAANRMARMIGLDHRDISIPEAKRMARQVLAKIENRLFDAMTKLDNGGPVFIIGHGADERSWIPSFVEVRPHWSIDEEISRVFPAYAVCKLLEHTLEIDP